MFKAKAEGLFTAKSLTSIEVCYANAAKQDQKTSSPTTNDDDVWKDSDHVLKSQVSGEERLALRSLFSSLEDASQLNA